LVVRQNHSSGPRSWARVNLAGEARRELPGTIQKHLERPGLANRERQRDNQRQSGAVDGPGARQWPEILSRRSILTKIRIPNDEIPNKPECKRLLPWCRHGNSAFGFFSDFDLGISAFPPLSVYRARVARGDCSARAACLDVIARSGQ